MAEFVARLVAEPMRNSGKEKNPYQTAVNNTLSAHSTRNVQQNTFLKLFSGSAVLWPLGKTLCDKGEQ